MKNDSSVAKTAKRATRRRFDIDVIFWQVLTAIALLSLVGSLYIVAGLPKHQLPRSADSGACPTDAELEPTCFRSLESTRQTHENHQHENCR